MKSSISQSLDKIRLIESLDCLAEAPAVATPVAAAAGKGLGRFIPGVGAALGAYDAYERAKKGDYAGAALSGAGGIASLIPGVGTAASIGLAGAQALRDKARTGSYLPSDEEQTAAVAKVGQPVVATAQAPVAKAANPQVLSLQKQLIAKGARIRPDGIMGPATQAAMKQFPEIQMAGKINKIKGTYMSESEKIAALRARLTQIENQQVNEGPMDYLKGAAALGGKAVQGIKSFAGGMGKGISNPRMTSLPNVASGTTAAAKGAKTGAALARNPGKVAAAGAAGGAAALAGGQALMSPGAKPGGGARPAASGAGGAAKPAAAAPMQISLDPSEMDELKSLAAEFGQSTDPATQAMMKQYNTIMTKIR